MTTPMSSTVGTNDLRLLVPACSAWACSAALIGAPEIAELVALVLWVVGSAAVAAAAGVLSTRWMRGAQARGMLSVVALSLAAAALVSTVIAVNAPLRQPLQLVEAAHAGRFVAATVVTSETVQPAAAEPGDDGPVRATLVRWRIGESEATGAVPVLLFDGSGRERIGIGATLELGITLAAIDPGDDVGFLAFAAGVPRVTALPPWYLDWANTTRAKFAEAATGLPGAGGDLLPGLAIGDTSAVDDNLDDAMKATALSHLTAVSGANCAIVVGLIMIAGRAFGMSRRWRIGTSIAVLIAFVVLVTPEPSVMRAAVMASLVLLALARGRAVRGMPVLALAALILLAGDPWLSRSFGFVLSVLATGGLLLLAAPLARLISRVMPLPIAAVIAVPLAAQISCQPILILLNPTIPTYGVIANVLAEPAAPIATVVGLVACVALSIAPPMGKAIIHLAWLPSAWIAAVAEFFAHLPGGALPWFEGAVGVALLAVVTAAVLAALFAPSLTWRRRSAVISVMLLVTVGGGSAGTAVTRALFRPSNWQIAVCDIGQGDATLVRSDGKVALIDTGAEPDLLLRCLDDLGITRLDVLVLTHFDLDHVGGAQAVVGRADRVLVGPTSESTDEALVAEFSNHGATVVRASRGLSGMLGELRWQVLWPKSRLGSVEPGNDASIAMSFTPVGECENGCLSSVFLADLGERMQNHVLAAGPVPRVDVVKVAHHGSADQSAAFYEKVRATVGVIGVGEDNGYGHPTDSLLDILSATRTVAARTDTMGLILLSPSDTPGSVALWSESDGTAD
ncbi:MAG: ComEC/Rec2 family competence protein [Microbacteriaceae bacterium]